MAESMLVPQFVTASVVVAIELILNFLNYFGWLSRTLWLLWEDYIIAGGLVVLPQVMWLTFVPFIHNSVLHGIISGSLAVAMMVSVPSYYGDAGAVAVAYGMVKEPVPMRPGPWGGEGGWEWDDWVYTGVKCCAESSCQDMQ
ncbi:Maltose excess protein 1 chloroplastic [Zea mays]|uniref:Maltose excess protein 1 chloroplastic n=1 Tax=Zea mays TaxID=4577 RepID=A0A1D6KNG8_MAIZE|nr:Maltose excess protein 1 chloroplastic [Zea mays]